MTQKEAEKQIGGITKTLQGTLDKGWVCGETKMPLALDHQQRLISAAQAEADAICQEITA